MWIYIIGILCTVFNGAIVTDEKTGTFCNKEISYIEQSTYQKRLVLNDDQLYDKKSIYYPYGKFSYCETTLQTWQTRYTKFMFYFESIDLERDDGHLEFYVNEISNTRVTGLEDDIYGRDKPKGVFTVDGYLRIKYVPERSQNITNIFTIIMTSFDDGPCLSYDYVCDNGRCIYRDIACNSYDSCGDGSGCNLDSGIIAFIVIALILSIAVVISIVWLFYTKWFIGTPEIVQSTTTRTQAVTCTSNRMPSRPKYGINQRSPNPTNMSTCTVAAPTNSTTAATDPVAAPTNVANPNINQQDHFRPNCDLNQGIIHQSNQEASAPHPQTNGQVDMSASPPSYDEIMLNDNEN